MEVRFVKGKAGRTCGWTALRPPRTHVPGAVMAAGADLPHDLSTFVIEHALGIERGFWGCVAAGGTFRSLQRRPTAPGRAVVKAFAPDLDEAEVRVNAAYRSWRAGGPTPAAPALDEALVAWRALEEGGELVLRWAAPAPARRRRTS